MSGTARRAILHGVHRGELRAGPSAAGAAALLELRRVSHSWQAGDGACSAAVRALRGVQLVLHAGELVAITGAPGSGKSTLLRCAAGIVHPDGGVVAGAAAARASYVGAGDDWAGRVAAAIAGGARVLLLDVLDPPTIASPRAVAAMAGSASEHGCAVVVAARDRALLPAFATRLVTLSAGRIVASVRPLATVRARRSFVAERARFP